MKTPEELKAQAVDESGCCGMCECYRTTVDNPFGCQEAQLKTMLVMELVQYTEQLESTISQVGKALCNNDSATLEELLNAVDQLKSASHRLKREKNAALVDFKTYRDRNIKRESGVYACDMCECWGYDEEKEPCPCPTNCDGCDGFRWRGICKENTKE